MTVYKVTDNHIEFQTMSTTPSMIAKQLGNVDLIENILLQPSENTSLTNVWKDVDIQFEDVLTKNSVLPDISLWLRMFLVLSPKAFRSLEEELSVAGEFLSIRFLGEQWYLFTPLLFGSEDKDHCIEKIEYGCYAGLEQLVFCEDDVESKVLFKSTLEGPSSLFCTDRFVDMCKSQNLKGLNFTTELTSLFE
ncbi:hypothetical protein [Vibrio vulnificus]|uniref:hypothetical protein n=1 Tax=Vibrio vulnificus TaxID=672 RepID=UPI001CDCF01F|nr:hypothetical protein [Vibrio vulnificus]EKA7356432.1 hypothetical protein [Vibrio vulnificus]MCA3913108.1 hypothetical protein [Vibrio vulnificus]